MLVVSCSPRKDGNTEILLRECEKGARDSGAEVEFVRLSELEIRPCAECLACHRDGRCVVDDDMQALYPKLADMDAVVLGSPMFFMGITAWGKAFIDRCQPFWAMKYLLGKEFVPREKVPRRGAFVSVGGTRFGNLFDGAVNVVRALFAVLEVRYEDELLIGGVDRKGEILEHPEALKRSYELGYKLGRRWYAEV